MTEKMQNMPTPSLIYPKSSGLYLMSRVQELTANVADLIETLCGRDRQLAAMEAIFNDPNALKKRLEDLSATGTPPALMEHPEVTKVQSNGKDATA